MASTLQNIIATVRGVRAVDPGKVNYGVTDKLAPPYVNLYGYEHEITYDTGGASIRNAKYHIRVTDLGQDEAEDIASAIDAAINSGLGASAVTPTAMSNLQTGYRVGQFEDRLYQYVVEMDYELQESIPASL